VKKKWVRWSIIVATLLITVTVLLAGSSSLETVAAPQYEEEHIRWCWDYPDMYIRDVTGQLQIAAGDHTWYYEAEIYYDDGYGAGTTELEIGLWAYSPGSQDFRIFVVHYDDDGTFYKDYEFQVAWSRLHHHFWFKADLIDENTIRVTIYDCDDDVLIFRDDVSTVDDNYEIYAACLSDEYWESNRNGVFRGEFHRAFYYSTYDWEDLNWETDEWWWGNSPADCPHKDAVQYAIPADSCECDMFKLDSGEPLYTHNDYIDGEMPFKASGSSRRQPRPDVAESRELMTIPTENNDAENPCCDLDSLMGMENKAGDNAWARMDSWNTTSDPTPEPTLMPTNTPPPTPTQPRPTPVPPLPLNFDGYVNYWYANCIVQDLFGAPGAIGWAYWGDDITDSQCLAVVEQKRPQEHIGMLGLWSNWFLWQDIGLGYPQYGDGGCCYACVLKGWPPVEICGYSYEVITRYP